MYTDEWVSFIDHLTTRPGMWVGSANYDLIVTFLNGYNHALGGAMLAGFHEWLEMRFGRGHSLAWPALIRYETLGYPDDQNETDTDGDDKLLSVLRDLLTEYFRHRKTIGLRNVYYDHGKWIRQFDWFNENVERYGSSDGPRKTEPSVGHGAADDAV